MVSRPSPSSNIFNFYCERLLRRYTLQTIFLHRSLSQSTTSEMCYYRLIKFTCSCDKREIWISHCTAPTGGLWEIEGVWICRNHIIYTPCPQTIQHICMGCFQRLYIGRQFVACSHFPDVRKKVHALDRNTLQRTWSYVVTVTEDQFRQLVAHDGVVLRHESDSDM